MNKLLKSTLSLASVTMLLTGMQAAEKKAANVLFIAFDDLKPELGCYGNKIVKNA